MLHHKNRGMGIGLIVIGILWLIGLFAWASGASATVPDTNTNEVPFWCGSVELGTKITPTNQTSFTVPPPPAGISSWSLLIIKAGSDQSVENENEVFPNPVVGQAYSHSSGKIISHVILCYGPPVTTTTTGTTTSSSTIPSTTTSSSTTLPQCPEEPCVPDTQGITTTSSSTTSSTTTTSTTIPSTTTSTTTTTTCPTCGPGQQTVPTTPSTTSVTTTVPACFNCRDVDQATTTTVKPTTTIPPTTSPSTTAVRAAAVPEDDTIPDNNTTLPVTGFPVLPLAGVGFLAIAAGETMRRLSR